MALITPEEQADAVIENPSYLFDFMGRHLMPERIRVRLHGEDMEAIQALFHLMHHVLTDRSASDVLKTIAGDCRSAMADAVADYFRERERFVRRQRADCTED